MVDPKRAGVTEAEWAAATASCHELRVARIVQETPDARSIVLEIPEDLKGHFAYRAGQFLSFKIPYQGKVLVRSYSLCSSPDCDAEHKIAVKRVADGRISNWIHDELEESDALMVTPPAGRFVLDDDVRKLVLFSAGSGITPVISIIKSALATTDRSVKLVYANRDADSIIFADEIAQLAARHGDRFEVVHSLDDVNGLLDLDAVKRHVGSDTDGDFYLCGPGPFMATVEAALEEMGVHMDRIHVEHFASPHDPGEAILDPAAPAAGDEVAPDSITIVLDGATHEVPYEPGERVLQAARRAGIDPPFSCEEGYCSCCMAKLADGRVVMAANDCLTPELLEEGWVLTCQSRCVSPKIRVEYPD
jgi:3-ketosteroid 9alpha-monooxygenase subunit B